MWAKKELVTPLSLGQTLDLRQDLDVLLPALSFLECQTHLRHPNTKKSNGSQLLMEKPRICTQVAWSGGLHGVMKWGAEEEAMPYTSVRDRRAANTEDCKDQPSWRKGGEMPTHLLNISASSRKIFESVPSGKQWVKAAKIDSAQQQGHSKKIPVNSILEESTELKKKKKTRAKRQSFYYWHEKSSVGLNHNLRSQLWYWEPGSRFFSFLQVQLERNGNVHTPRIPWIMNAPPWGWEPRLGDKVWPLCLQTTAISIFWPQLCRGRSAFPGTEAASARSTPLAQRLTSSPALEGRKGNS